jgi:hypothetical protein
MIAGVEGAGGREKEDENDFKYRPTASTSLVLNASELRDFYDFNLYVLIYFNVAASCLSTIAKQVLMLMNFLTALRSRIGFSSSSSLSVE